MNKKTALIFFAAFVIVVGLISFSWANIKIKDSNNKFSQNKAQLKNIKQNFNPDDGAQYFNTFANSTPGSEAAYLALDKIRDDTSHTDVNIEKLRSILFDRSRSASERAMAARIYSELITEGVSPEWVQRIRNDLEEIAKTTDQKELGQACIFALTRTLSNADSDELFKRIVQLGLDKEFINHDAYMGEVVHRAFVGGYLSSDLAPLIINDNNAYGRNVLYGYLSNSTVASETAQKIDINNYNALVNAVETGAPQFSGAPSAYSMLDAVQFYDWANSYANVRSALAPNADKVYQDTIIQIFNKPDLDPRNLVALLQSPSSDLLVSAARAGNNSVGNNIQRAEVFLQTYQNIPPLGDIYGELTPVLNYKN
jgi:uncharacterized protein YukE